MNEKIDKVIEGNTILYVPKIDSKANIPPRMPAFYNKSATFNRNISIDIYRVFIRKNLSSVKIGDCFSGVGSRGIRSGVEIPDINEIHLNDINPFAIHLANLSAKENRIIDRCHFTTENIYKFLINHSSSESRFNILDMDPFGSPAPYIDCGLRSISNKGLFSITATDMAVLCGIYPNVSYRKYLGKSFRTEYSHEVGIRLILGLVIHNALRLKLGIIPIFAHRSFHYFRVYVSVNIASECLKLNYSHIGFIQHCFRCGYRSEKKYSEVCPECDSKLKSAGPLWIGAIYDKNFLNFLISEYEHEPNRSIYNLAKIAIREIDLPPTYYTIDNLCSEIKVAPPSLEDVISSLKDEGFQASRTILNSSGIKTDANHSVMLRIVKKLA